MYVVDIVLSRGQNHLWSPDVNAKHHEHTVNILSLHLIPEFAGTTREERSTVLDCFRFVGSLLLLFTIDLETFLGEASKPIP